VLKHNSSIRFIDEIYCSARGMISVAETKFNNNEFEDIAYYEPYYLKKYLPKHKTKTLFKRS
ncbi:MAG: hypothetical protein ACPGVB_02610, partial [Chitinophagales bacterium]